MWGPPVHGAATASTTVHAHRRAEPSSAYHRLAQRPCGSTTCKCQPLGPIPRRSTGRNQAGLCRDWVSGTAGQCCSAAQPTTVSERWTLLYAYAGV